ncbi:Hemin transport system permease protein HmuU [Falsiruegeria litorea R37]|uniref:Hemin transport system permease protein HmuU n=1 Tax=Falsiruegeria litorea R37 TaxID=1200284 RepID=A0A1Y5SRE2_9RHOB|nr:iron ABC transporter permease [Falsiruegeria litorea]SLN46452.1 Hemin transport system permease protein HmuU [Falsiruegeria litorea R37]
MTALTEQAAPIEVDRRALAQRMTWVLAALLGVVSLSSLAVGASEASLWRALGDLTQGNALSTLDRVVLVDIRLPRLIMGIMVGAALALSGVMMQGLFRNPLADPGIVGVSAGAGLGAILSIVLGGMLPVAVLTWAGSWLTAIAAFLGSWISTLLLYRVSTRRGQTSVATMLLAGIALGAMTGALGGILVYLADDQQLRDLTFWGMGSLAAATWTKIATAAPIMALAAVASIFIARGLNGLSMGEAVAHHIGINVQRTKNVAILSVAAATGAAVAVSGGIGFIGIVVPHLLRLSTGPDHLRLLPNAALLGASLLLTADMISRVIVAPAELPIGIVTAILGAPVFLWILLRRFGQLGM